MKRLIIILSLVAIPITTQIYSNKNLSYNRKDLKCQMQNLWHEARGESLQGQVAVAKVVLNRAMASGKSICSTIFAPYQFSWTATKKHLEPKQYPLQIFQAAHLALLTDFPATHYHALYVKPAWAKRLKKIKQINNHIFYYDN